MLRAILAELVLLTLQAGCLAIGLSRPRAPPGGGEDLHNLTQWLWSSVHGGGLPPSRRQGHAAVELGQRVYIVGGCEQEIQCYNDVHFFDAEALTWSQEVLQGEAPEPRGGHSATAVGGDMVIFGGASSDATFGDVYHLDLDIKRWSRVATSALNGSTGPGRRTGHAAGSDAHGRLYIFGGYSADGNYLNDMWVLTLSSSRGGEMVGAWLLVQPHGTAPPPREAHTMTFINGKFVVFGGNAADGTSLSDVHVFDLEAHRWTQLPPNAGGRPKARQAHSAARHGEDLVIAGGCETSGETSVCFSDVWSLNLTDAKWTPRTLHAGSSWLPREGHTATFVRGRMFLFGGCDFGAECYGDLAALDTQEPCPGSCGFHGVCVDNSFCRCTTPGFTGHDCMQPLVCKDDCGLHGVCSQDGRCLCENGWTGFDCATELPCPGESSKCSGQGQCLIDGTCMCNAGFMGKACETSGCPLGCSGHGDCGEGWKCTCHQGWSGDSCSTSTSLARGEPASTVGAGPGGPVGRLEEVLALLDPFARVHHEAEKASREQELPENKDFGIQNVNSRGKSGPQVACAQFCNFRGLCEDGKCFCQPHYYGETCAEEEIQETGTVNIFVSLLIAAVSFFIAFFVSIFLVHFREKKRQAAEASAGYNL